MKRNLQFRGHFRGTLVEKACLLFPRTRTLKFGGKYFWIFVGLNSSKQSGERVPEPPPVSSWYDDACAMQSNFPIRLMLCVERERGKKSSFVKFFPGLLHCRKIFHCIVRLQYRHQTYIDQLLTYFDPLLTYFDPPSNNQNLDCLSWPWVVSTH